MNRYETNIDKVEGSAFAIGENAAVNVGGPSSYDRAQLAAALRAVVVIAARADDAAASGLVDEAITAKAEVESARPSKAMLQRVADGARKLISNLGPALVEAGALADAADKIAAAARHLG